MRNLSTSRLFIWVAAVFLLGCTSSYAATFTDNFNRADSSDISNSWVESNAGNSYGNPSNASISSGCVRFDRQGWGNNAYSSILHSTGIISSCSANFLVPDLNNAVSASLQTNNVKGGFVLARFVRQKADNHIHLQVSKSAAGAWEDWTTYADLGSISGWFTCKIDSDFTTGFVLSVIYGGNTIWSNKYTDANQAVLSGASVQAAWEDWSSYNAVYADDFSVTTSDYASGSVVNCKQASDGDLVSISGAVVTAKFYDDGGVVNGFAVQDAARCSGIRVSASSNVKPGDIVDITGTAATANGERIVNATSVSIQSSISPVPAPICMSIRNTGGGDFGNQAAVVDDACAIPARMSIGLNNIGMFVKVCGKVTAVNETGAYNGCFYVDDGSCLNDGSGNTGIMCRPPADGSGNASALPKVGDYVVVSGVLGVNQIITLNVRYLWTTGISSIINSPASITATGPDSKPCAELLDGSTSTGVVTRIGSYTFKRASSGAIVSISMHITATSDGSYVINQTGIMPLVVNYKAGSGWYKTRIPFGTSDTVKISWNTLGATWNEISINERTPLGVRLTAGKKSVSVSLSGVTTDPACDITGAFNVGGWFDKSIVDGFTVAEKKTELINKLHEFHTQSLRYPGGTPTYGYPPTREAIAVYRNAGLGEYASGLWNQNCLWSSPEAYFTFCRDAGLTAWYELNPGYWYDSQSLSVNKTTSMDLRSDGYTGDYVSQAVAYAVSLAQLAQNTGVDAVWEIGNEDYCYYTPATYARLCKAFIDGIRAVYPSAKFAVCGDSTSWSDSTWSNGFSNALYSQGARNINYSSEHFYMGGIGDVVNGQWTPRPWGTSQEVGDSTARAWSGGRSLELGYLNRFNNIGLGPTKLAITECNPITPNWYDTGGTPEIEHSVGRALGEAEVTTNMQKDGASVFLHDLVRHDFNSTYFGRLDYYPGNPAGKRYNWFPEGAAVGIVTLHGQGHIVYNQGGICVSKHQGFVYVTVVNRTAQFNDVSVNLDGVTLDRGKPMDIHSFRAASPDCCFFDYYTSDRQLALPASGQQITLESPSYSVVGVKIYTL